MIDFEHVSKEYKKGGKLALEDVNFHVDDGEFVFLLGHSGAGKSTLLKLILREEVPSEGKVLVDGRDVARMRRCAPGSRACAACSPGAPCRSAKPWRSVVPACMCPIRLRRMMH